MKKNLLIFIIAIIIIGATSYIACRINNSKSSYGCERQNGTANIKVNKSLSFGIITNGKYFFVILKADAASTGKTVKYYIIDPHGTTLDKGEFDKNGHLSLDKKFTAVKGNWQIKFEASDPDETIQCEYTFACADTEAAVYVKE